MAIKFTSGTIAWVQASQTGKLSYKVISPPYTIDNCITMLEPPKGFKGKTMQILGGTPPIPTYDVDLGIMRVNITPDTPLKPR